jgi:hypothetical protein
MNTNPNVPYQATSSKDLEFQIVSSTVAKNEREWWAHHEIARLRAEVDILRDMLFARGAMKDAPCFCCGYNGPGYFNPETHSCAAKHHVLYGSDSE